MTGLYSTIINLFPFKPAFSRLGHGFGALEHRFWMDFPDLGQFAGHMLILDGFPDLGEFGWISRLRRIWMDFPT